MMEVFRFVCSADVSQSTKWKRKLNDYMDGKHEILRRRMSEGASNIRVVANHAEYISDIATGYVHGAAISYSGTGSDMIDNLFITCCNCS